MSNFYNESTAAVAAHWETDLAAGLPASVAAARLAQNGQNILEKGQRKRVWQMFFEQFKSFMIVILLAAALISGALGEWADTVIIMIVVLLNAVLGAFQENKAEESLAALQKMSAPHAKVRRGGQIVQISAEDVVCGDLVILETGDVVPADLRLTAAINLQVQESALTGESVPVEKQTQAISGVDIPLGDRSNMAYSSSLVTYGRGEGIVVQTAMATEVGRIAKMLQTTDNTETPMKRRLESLGKVMGIGVLIICAIIFTMGLFEGNDPFEMFFIAVSLAVAAIPEGLPAIATIVLSLGVQRMVRRNAIIRTLPSVETLGSANVICSDKTGTLTQNKMTVEQLAKNGSVQPLAGVLRHLDEHAALLMECAILCNDAKPTEQAGKYLGDPTETALLAMGEQAGQFQTDTAELLPRVAELPFDSQRKLMSTVHQKGRNLRIYTKGGVDELLACCSKILWQGEVLALGEVQKKWILECNADMAEQALRVLAFAYREVERLPQPLEFEQQLIFIGLVGMIDPPRPEAREAVATCKAAGIRAIMITGDHVKTAQAIATDLGILNAGEKVLTGTELAAMSQEQLAAEIEDYSVYARVAPEHKVRIVEAWQNHGAVVAMTGDGVNDAPALKRADIGAAMGITGTEVAKEAADMVLTDDNFATVVAAVEEGRRIYDNILKAIQFLLSCNVGEIITLFVAVMLNWGSPLLPIHILWVNLVTDSFSALALGVEPAEPDIMQRKAKLRNQSIFSGGVLWRICYQGALVGVLTITAFVYGNRVDQMTGQTMAFAVLAFSQLVHAFNVRSPYFSAFNGKMQGNRFLWYATGISAVLMLAVLLFPPLQQVFRLATLDSAHWLMVAALTFAPLLVVEIAKLLKINASLYEID